MPAIRVKPWLRRTIELTILLKSPKPTAVKRHFLPLALLLLVTTRRARFHKWRKRAWPTGWFRHTRTGCLPHIIKQAVRPLSRMDHGWCHQRRCYRTAHFEKVPAIRGGLSCSVVCAHIGLWILGMDPDPVSGEGRKLLLTRIRKDKTKRISLGPGYLASSQTPWVSLPLRNSALAADGLAR